MVCIILNLDVDKILKSYAIFKYSRDRKDSTPKPFEEVLPTEMRAESFSVEDINTHTYGSQLNFTDISTSGC